MQSPEFLSASSRLTVDLTALADNWRAMNERSGKARAAAVLKADAYGLGVVHAAPALYAAGARDFFVASVEEGGRSSPACSGWANLHSRGNVARQRGALLRERSRADHQLGRAAGGLHGSAFRTGATTPAFSTSTRA
ncbi:alanine racemase [Sinorhizobium meliloti]|nr:alanine racemase [Sinorhizobium meliloti]